MALVLVVDDDEAIARLLSELVEDHGHTALTAENGAQALITARARPPALIISDVMMPVMDGYALLQAVREAPELNDTLIVLMSAAFARQPLRQTTGADGFVEKPFDVCVIEGLLSRLSEASV